MFENEELLIRIAFLAGNGKRFQAQKEAMDCECRITRLKALAIISNTTTAVSPSLTRT